MAKGKRPGVMIYFDVRSCLQSLSLEQKGMLLDAILSYGEEGTLTEIKDPVVLVAWNFIRPKIDTDGERYERRCEKARDAANTRWENIPEDACSPSKCERIPSNASKCERICSMPTSTSTTSSFVSPDGSTKSKQNFEHDSLPYRAARWLADQIEGRLPNCTPHSEATLQSWAIDFDRCHRLDGHTWEDINDVLQFSQGDPFWCTNILSAGKFRKRYTQLLARMGGGQ